nr:integrase, catalytic region, zinc finger, CCHC-type, peptidase aspartic, catalytic [Tanacetum cinerariifolium]
MIMPSKDILYNGRKGISFENPRYFKKAKDSRPSLYDEKVIGLGYTSMFLTHSDEALEIEKFKRSRENKIEFAYDYENLNASYVNEKINFSDDYFQEIINPDFEKIDSPFQQTSSLKPYVPNVILEKIIIDLEDEVSSENAISDLENQSENDFHVVEKECDKVENSKVIAPGLFKLSVSQSVSPMSMSKTFCASKNVENLDTFSSVRRPKHSGVIWKEKGSSNTSNVDLSFVSLSKLNKDVKRCSRKDLLSCNNSHLDYLDLSLNHQFGCSKHMTGNRALLTNFVEKFLGTVRFGNNDFVVIVGYGDVVIGSITINKVYYVEGLGHNLFSVGQFYDKGLKVAFRKSTWFVRNEDCVDLLTGCSKHMTGNYALLTNFVEKFLGTVRFGNNDFALFVGYGDVVIGSMTIKKVFYVEGLGHNLFSVGQFCDKGLEVAFRKSTCFVRNEDGVDLLTGDRSSNLYTIVLNEVALNSSTCLIAKASSSQSWL